MFAWDVFHYFKFQLIFFLFLKRRISLSLCMKNSSSPENQKKSCLIYKLPNAKNKLFSNKQKISKIPMPSSFSFTLQQRFFFFFQPHTMRFKSCVFKIRTEDRKRKEWGKETLDLERMSMRLFFLIRLIYL